MGIKDLVGQRFSRLVVDKFSHINKNGRSFWICICDCGKRKTVSGNNLKTGNSKSCGCMHHELLANRNMKHGLSNHPLCDVWFQIKRRCNNPKAKAYKNYGGRGISVCKEWDSDFISFYNWAVANGYKYDLTIERINNNGNYTPENCKFISKGEQMNNTRRNHLITYHGKNQTISKWAIELGINRDTLLRRINHFKMDVKLLLKNQ